MTFDFTQDSGLELDTITKIFTEGWNGEAGSGTSDTPVAVEVPQKQNPRDRSPRGSVPNSR